MNTNHSETKSTKQTESGNRRIYEITVAKSLGTILVLFGHSEPIKDHWPVTWDILSLFRMPLFFFISGLILNHSASTHAIDFPTHWKKYCKPFIMPYLAISLSFTAIKLVAPTDLKRPIELSNVWLDILLYPWNNPAKFLWFIYALFIIRLISYFLFRLPKPAVIAITITLSIIPFHHYSVIALNSITQYSPFFFLGFLFSDKKTEVIRFCNKPVVFLGAWIAFIAAYYASVQSNFSSQFAIVSAGIFGGCGAISTACLLAKKIPEVIPETINKYSLEIYLLQFFFILPVSRVLMKLGIPNELIIPISFIAGGIGPILFARTILRRSPKLSTILVGKQQ